MMRLLAIGALCASCSEAFSPSARLPLVSSVSRTLLAESDYDDSYPSDSSEDQHFTVEEESSTTIDVENKPSTDSEAVVSSIIDYLPSTLGEVSSEDRAAINEAVLRLEALNPTEDPAYSPLINGVWALKYAGGYSDSKIPSPTRQLALFLVSGQNWRDAHVDRGSDTHSHFTVFWWLQSRTFRTQLGAEPSFTTG